MSLAIVHSRAQLGVDAPLVTVETHLSNGLPGLSIVGLPETAVKESKDRVRSALLNARFEFPARRITINLAPADLPKEGGRFDLPIALGILAASGQVPADALEGIECVGELALTGELRGVRGVLPAALRAHATDRALIVPAANAEEAALSRDGPVFAPAHLLGLVAHLQGETPLSPAPPPAPAPTPTGPDLAEVKGQHQARRALEIAAAGGHPLLLVGPPGTGKTLLASRLPGILPPLPEADALELAAVRSVDGQPVDGGGQRPFRAPHHTASGVALVGGGTHPRPGEISLAHHGVLFLDELPEFQRKVLEVLREPLESGEIMISRAARQVRFPARFQLVAAMNPCPCGYHGDPEQDCRCTPDQVRRYRQRISGPLLDRIDLQVSVNRLPHAVLAAATPGEDSATVRARVIRARQRQQARQGTDNHRLSPRALDRWCALDAAGEALLVQAAERLRLSARGYHRVLKVARTMADLDGVAHIDTDHLTEALNYRAPAGWAT